MGTLPNPGGLFQQHPAHIRKMESVFKAQHLVNEEVPLERQEARNRLEERARSYGRI